MRYALGIFIGALLPGIAFIGATIINLMGYGVTDPGELSSIWGLFMIWSLISIIIFIIPMIIARFAKRDLFRELALFEIGGFAFFTPFWFLIATELTGNSAIYVLLNGVENALPGPGQSGIIGLSIPSFLLILMLLGLFVIGVIILRPTFVQGTTKPKPKTELDALRDTVEEPVSDIPTADIPAVDIPAVAPPVIDESAKDELRAMLTEFGLAPPIIDLIMGAGISSVPELVATGAEQLANITGLSKKEAEDLHMQVQKKVWFGGI